MFNFADWFRGLSKEQQDPILEKLWEATKWIGNSEISAAGQVAEIKELLGQAGLDCETYT